MSSSKKDFEYDSKDISLLKVSLQCLSEQERFAVKLGVFSGVVTYGCVKYWTKFGPVMTGLSVLLLSVFNYNAYTHQARFSYGRLASLCNRNVSLKLNEMMK